MSESGVVTSVESMIWGGNLTAAAAVAAATLTVEPPMDFDSDGGQLQLNGTTLDFTEADPVTGIVTLAVPLAVAADAGDVVQAMRGGQPAVDLYAMVSFGEGEPVPVRIPTNEIDAWSEGPCDPPIPVEVSDDLQRIESTPGRPLVRDGSFIDPGTLPDITLPTAPPLAPELQLRGLSRSQVLSWLNQEPGEVLNVSMLISGTPTPYADPNADNPILIDGFPDGTPLAPNVVYDFEAYATNSFGDGPTTSVSGTLRLEDSTSIADLAVDKLLAGDLTAVIAVISKLLVGLIEISGSNGIVIPQPGTEPTHFPSDGTPIKLTAEVLALAITILGKLQLRGTDNEIAPGASLELAAGVSTPTQAPGVVETWTQLDMDTPGEAALYHGLTDDGSVNWITPFPLGGLWLKGINKTTGASLSNAVSGTNLPGFAPAGVTRIGTTYYVLGQDFNRSGNWYVYIINSSYVKTGEWQYNADGGSNVPTIGNDGTNIAIARWNTVSAVDRIVVRTFTPSTGASVGSAVVCALANPKDLTGLYYGTADFGAIRIIATHSTGVHAFSVSAGVGTRQTSHEWPRAASSAIRGLFWNGTEFYTSDATGHIWRYGGVLATSTARSIDYSWYDSDATGGTHETARGPAKAHNQRARSLMAVTTGEPNDNGGTDDPDSVRIWIGGQRQADLGAGVTSATYNIPSTGTTTKATDFAAAGTSVADIHSAASDAIGLLIELLGDGAGRTGPYSWGSNGKSLNALGARGNGTNQTITDSTWTLVNLAGTPAHDHGGIALASSVATVSEAGLYSLKGNAQWAANATGRRIIKIESFVAEAVGAGTELCRAEAPGIAQTAVPAADDVYLAAGTKIRLVCFQTSTGNLTLAQANMPAHLSIRKVG